MQSDNLKDGIKVCLETALLLSQNRQDLGKFILYISQLIHRREEFSKLRRGQMSWM